MVRASYIVRTIPRTSSDGLRLERTSATFRSSWPEPLEGVVLALDRHDHVVGRGQAVHGQQPERRRAVDEHEVVLVADRVERPLELELAAERGHQLDLGAGEVEGRRDHEQVLEAGRLDAVERRRVVHEDVVDRALDVAGVDARARSMALPWGSRSTTRTRRPDSARRGAEVHRGRGLAHATLLVGDGDDPGQLERRGRRPRRRSAVTASAAGSGSAAPPGSVGPFGLGRGGGARRRLGAPDSGVGLACDRGRRRRGGRRGGPDRRGRVRRPARVGRRRPRRRGGSGRRCGSRRGRRSGRDRPGLAAVAGAGGHSAGPREVGPSILPVDPVGESMGLASGSVGTDGGSSPIRRDPVRRWSSGSARSMLGWRIGVPSASGVADSVTSSSGRRRPNRRRRGR